MTPIRQKIHTRPPPPPPFEAKFRVPIFLLLMPHILIGTHLGDRMLPVEISVLKFLYVEIFDKHLR